MPIYLENGKFCRNPHAQYTEMPRNSLAGVEGMCAITSARLIVVVIIIIIIIIITLIMPPPLG